MKQDAKNFRHESLQDQKSIKEILTALTNGVAKGKVTLSDDRGEVVLQPEGLLHLKITAGQDEDANSLTLRLRWRSGDQGPKKKALTVSDK